MTHTPLTMAENLSDRRKKLLFRAWHRGTREADLLMGRFADSFVPICSDDDVDAFEILLSETDPDIYDWITGRLAIPHVQYTHIIRAMIAFYNMDTP
jgi:antitoxin CptB